MGITRKLGKLSSPERKVFNFLYQSYYHRAYRIAFIMTKNGQLAEDVAQEAFVKALNNFERIKKEEHFVKWLTVVTTNTAIDAMRRNKKYLLIEDPDTRFSNTVRTEFLPEESLEESENRRVILEALYSLKSIYQTVIYLRYYGDLTFTEIAQTLGEKEPTIRSRCNRALKLMKQKLEMTKDASMQTEAGDQDGLLQIK